MDRRKCIVFVMSKANESVRFVRGTHFRQGVFGGKTTGGAMNPLGRSDRCMPECSRVKHYRAVIDFSVDPTCVIPLKPFPYL